MVVVADAARDRRVERERLLLKVERRPSRDEHCCTSSKTVLRHLLEAVRFRTIRSWNGANQTVQRNLDRTLCSVQ
jgi:hypothetical protein